MLKTKFKFRIVLIAATVLFGIVEGQGSVYNSLRRAATPRNVSTETVELKGSNVDLSDVVIGKAVLDKSYKGLHITAYSLKGKDDKETERSIKEEQQRFKEVLALMDIDIDKAPFEREISLLIRSRKMNAEYLILQKMESVRDVDDKYFLSSLLEKLEDFYSLKPADAESEAEHFNRVMEEQLILLHNQLSLAKREGDRVAENMLNMEIVLFADLGKMITEKIRLEQEKAYHLLFKYSDIEQIFRLIGYEGDNIGEAAKIADNKRFFDWSRSMLKYEEFKSRGIVGEGNILRVMGELKPVMEELIYKLKNRKRLLRKNEISAEIKVFKKAVKKENRIDKKILKGIKEKALSLIKQQGLPAEQALMKALDRNDDHKMRLIAGDLLGRIEEVREEAVEFNIPLGDLVLFVNQGNPLRIKKIIKRYRGAIKYILTPESGILHWVIVAKGMGVSVMTGVRTNDGSKVMESAVAGEAVIVHSRERRVIINPDNNDLERYGALKREADAFKDYLSAERMRPSRTLGGYSIPVRANVGAEEEGFAYDVNSSGADGAGLLRMELFYMGEGILPSEEGMKNFILGEADKCRGTVAVRYFDIKGDKELFGDLNEEDRAEFLKRFCSAVNAAYEESERKNIKVFFPMVEGARDVNELWKILELAGIEENSKDRMKIGFMIELKQAVENIRDIAERADFLSIGTNDLFVSYLKREDVTLEEARKYLDGGIKGEDRFVVLNGIKTIVREANEVRNRGNRINEVSVCGEWAAEFWFVQWLASLIEEFDLPEGFLSLSMSNMSVPSAKSFIRNMDAGAGESLDEIEKKTENRQKKWGAKLSKWAEQGITAMLEDEVFAAAEEDEKAGLIESLLFRMADRAFNGQLVNGKVYKDALCFEPIDILPRLEDDIFKSAASVAPEDLELNFAKIRQSYHIEREKIGENDLIKVRGEVSYDKDGIIDKIKVKFVKETDNGRLIPVSVRPEQTVVPKQGTFGTSGDYEVEQNLAAEGHMLFWDSHQQRSVSVRIHWNEERTGYVLRLLNGQGGNSFVLKPGSGVRAHIVPRGYKEEKKVFLKYPIYVIDVFHRWNKLIPLTLEEMSLYFNLLDLSSGNPQQHRDAENSITALIAGDSSWLGSTKADRVSRLVNFLYHKGPYMYEDIYPWLSKVLITAGTVLSLIEDSQYTKEAAIELLANSNKEFSKMLYESRGMGRDWAYRIISELFYKPDLEDKDEGQIRNNEFAIKLFGLNRCPQTWNILVEEYKRGDRGEADAVAEAIKARIWRKLNFIGEDVNERGYFTKEDIRVIQEALEGKIRVYGEEFIDSRRVRARALNLLFSIRDFNSRAGSGGIVIPQVLEKLFINEQKDYLSSSGNKMLNVSSEFKVMTKRPFNDYNGGYRTKVNVGEDYYYLDFKRHKDSSYRCELKRIVEKIRGKRTKTETIGYIDFGIEEGKVDVRRMFVKPEYKTVKDVRSTYARSRMDYSLMDMMKMVFLYYLYNKENIKDFSNIEFKDVMKEHRFSPAEVRTLEKLGFVLKENKEDIIKYIGKAKKIHLFLDGGRLMNEPYFEILLENGKKFYLILKGLRHSIRMPWVYKRIREDEQFKEILEKMVDMDRVFISGDYIISTDSARELEEFIRTEIGNRFNPKIKKELRELDSMI